MLKQLGWQSLQQRRLSYQLSMFCKIQQGLVSIPSIWSTFTYKSFSSTQCIPLSSYSDQAPVVEKVDNTIHWISQFSKIQLVV